MMAQKQQQRAARLQQQQHQRRGGMALAAAPAALALVAALALAAAAGARAAAFQLNMDPHAGQLSPSVLIMGEFDWALSPGAGGKPWSRCLDMVWRARRVTRGNKLNFVPTHHWLPREDGFGVSQFCYLHTTASDPLGKCLPWTPDKVNEFKASMTQCLAETLRQGFTPYIRPHLDDGTLSGTWRNALNFGPSVKYGGYSYKDIMLDPLTQALSAALKQVAAEGALVTPPNAAKPVVYVGLQGEMSGTIMRHTAEWKALIPGVRAAAGGGGLADVKVGVGLNFNALDATETASGAQPGVLGWMMGSGPRAARAPVPAIDGAEVHDLFTNQIDFLGISAYAPYTGPGMQLNEFENSAFNVGDGLRSLGNGLDLAALVRRGKLELHYSEFGIGGGKEGNGAPATSAAMVGRQPWAGVAGGYSKARDPWQRPDLQAFRSEFYAKTLQWLAAPSGRTYQVCDVFVWGMASWDLFGIYPDSSSGEGTYRDAAIVRQISNHNIKVMGAQVMASQGPAAAEVYMQALQNADAAYAVAYQQTSVLPDASAIAQAAASKAGDQAAAAAKAAGAAKAQVDAKAQSTLEQVRQQQQQQPQQQQQQQAVQQEAASAAAGSQPRRGGRLFGMFGR